MDTCPVPDAEPAWFPALAEFYRRVDDAVAAFGLSCRGCGACCHFESVDHILYASAMERAYLRSAVCADRPPSQGDSSLVDLLQRGLRCPFQHGDACRARHARVLGCRLHFCAASEEADRYAEQAHQELKRLHDAWGVEWDYAPLLPFAFGS